MEITFNIANVCNLKCSYCIFVWKWSGAKITDENLEWFNKLLEYYTFEKQERTSLTFSWGGEPLLFFKDIKKIIKSIQIKNRYLLDIYIITNWTIYNNEISQFIKEYNIFLVLSLDWTESSHDINRVMVNGESSYTKIMQNKHLLFTDVIDVNYTIYGNNFYNLVEWVSFIVDNFIQLRRLNFNFVFNSWIRSNERLVELKKQFDSFIDIYITKELYKKFETNLRNYSYLHSRESEDSCLGHLYINRDWNVFKCGAYEFNFEGKPLWSLKDTQGEYIDFLRRNVKNCSSKCHESKYEEQNKKLSLILFHIWKKYQIVDQYIDNSLRKFNY